MSGRTLRSWIIAGLLSLACSAQAAVTIPDSERQVLLAFYVASGGSSWTVNTNWNGIAGTECTWFGVTCDATGTTVIAIKLQSNNLTGTLPEGLQFLTNLETFWVFSNHLTGLLPPLTGVTNLKSFWVSSNQLTGSIPQLTGLTNLILFSAGQNQLAGSIPALTGLTNLVNFQVLSNQLTGPIPALTGLTNLSSFYVSGNQLTTLTCCKNVTSSVGIPTKRRGHAMSAAIPCRSSNA